MLYLLQLVSTHQVSFSSRAVKCDKKLQWLKYRIIPKRNSIQVACSILIIKCLPQVSLIPNLSLSVISAFLIKFHINTISIFTLIFNVFLLNIPFLHKDPNGYKESWLGLIHNCGRIPVQTCEESFILISGV